jgi:hypothetical protein
MSSRQDVGFRLTTESQNFLFALYYLIWCEKSKNSCSQKIHKFYFFNPLFSIFDFSKKKYIDFYTKNPTHCPNLGIDLFAKDLLFCLDKFGTKKSEQFKSTHLYRVSAKKLFLSQKCHIPTEGVLRHKGDSQTLFFL